MGGRLLCVPGTSHFWYMAFQGCDVEEEKSMLFRRANGYTYNETRSQVRHSDHFGYGWRGKNFLWPSVSGFYQDPAAPTCLRMDQDMGQGMPLGSFEAWQFGNPCCVPPKYIMGQVLDSSGVPISGAIVKGFRTSDGLYIGQTVSGADGRYGLVCPNTQNDEHFLVAYVDSATDLTGATVNTLVPTYVDGSP